MFVFFPIQNSSLMHTKVRCSQYENKNFNIFFHWMTTILIDTPVHIELHQSSLSHNSQSQSASAKKSTKCTPMERSHEGTIKPNDSAQQLSHNSQTCWAHIQNPLRTPTGKIQCQMPMTQWKLLIAHNRSLLKVKIDLYELCSLFPSVFQSVSQTQVTNLCLAAVFRQCQTFSRRHLHTSVSNGNK